MYRRVTPQSIAHRMRTIALLVIILCLGLVGVLLYFQLFNGDFFDKNSRRNFLRHETVSSLRGPILDRNGVPCATNKPVISLIWKGSCKAHLSAEQENLLNLIETITKTTLPEKKVMQQIENVGGTITLIENLPFETLCKVMERCTLGKNIEVQTHSTRYYPHGHTACHIIGYFRPTLEKRQGTMGLERLFEEQLKGVPGELETIVNSLGQHLSSREIKRAQDGEPLMITLDLTIQRIGESLFEEGQVGAFIAMDAEKGDLLAVVSKPSFDPNIFTAPVSTEVWKTCIEQKPFVNRALTSCYPPASVFKLITAATVLETGLITRDTSWFCAGEITYGGRSFRCAHYEHGGHGHIASIEEALALSCNIPFFEMGKRLSIDTLARYAHIFGLGESTGIIFPEKAGLIPTTAWKMKTLKEPWWQGETMLAAIGQTYCLATPLQMARVVGAICTGKLVRPRILLAESIDTKPLAIAPTTRALLQRSMRFAVKQGTASALNRLADIEIYGKTGTAQTSNRSKLDLGKEFLPHGWFVCYVKYKEHAPLVIAVFVENAGSSSVAIRLTKKFLTNWCEYRDTGACSLFKEAEAAAINDQADTEQVDAD